MGDVLSCCSVTWWGSWCSVTPAEARIVGLSSVCSSAGHCSLRFSKTCGFTVSTGNLNSCVISYSLRFCCLPHLKSWSLSHTSVSSTGIQDRGCLLCLNLETLKWNSQIRGPFTIYMRLCGSRRYLEVLIVRVKDDDSWETRDGTAENGQRVVLGLRVD